MGNSNGNKSSFEEHNWRKLEEQENKIILYNDVTRKSIERHEAVLHCDQGEASEICKWRENLNTDFCVVELYQYGVKRAGMCTAQPDLYVVTERIYLLRDIGSVSKAEAFLILRDVVSGLRVLFKKFGNFNPRPNLMGINAEGRAKVWTNENFAKFLPQKDTIPVETTQLGVVNNLIGILESKTQADPTNSFPLQYPKNLDFASTIKYINNIFTSLQGYQVDRVYIDRSEYAKKHAEIRQKVQMEELSRTKAIEAEERLREIEQLHENLRNQQIQLERKEQFLRMQTQQQQEELFRQQQLQLQRQQQLELQRQQLEMQRQRDRESQYYVVQQVQQIQQVQPPPSLMIDNSQGKIMKGTTSTIQSEVNYQGNVVYYNGVQYAQKNTLVVPQQNYAMPPQNNQFRQSNVSTTFQAPAQQVHQAQNRARQLSPRPPIPQPQHAQQHGQQPAQLRRKNSLGTDRMKKEIEMVDSMILMQEDQMSEQQNKKFVESRIIHYQM